MSDQNRALPFLNNPAVQTVVNLQRQHPGEMVFLEVAAAGALLYQHKRSKSRQERMREEAEEDLKRRGWDGGAKEHQRSGTGLLTPSAPPFPRPTSAPPPGYVPQGFQGVGAQPREDPMAYGSLPPQQGYGLPRDDSMAYGSMPGYQQPFEYPPQGPYQPPYGPPADQYQQQYGGQPPLQQPYGPPQGQWQPQYGQQPPSAPPGYQNYGPSGQAPFYPPR